MVGLALHQKHCGRQHTTIETLSQIAYYISTKNRAKNCHDRYVRICCMFSLFLTSFFNSECKSRLSISVHFLATREKRERRIMKRNICFGGFTCIFLSQNKIPNSLSNIYTASTVQTISKSYVELTRLHWNNSYRCQISVLAYREKLKFEM